MSKPRAIRPQLRLWRAAATPNSSHIRSHLELHQQHHQQTPGGTRRARRPQLPLPFAELP